MFKRFGWVIWGLIVGLTAVHPTAVASSQRLAQPAPRQWTSPSRIPGYDESPDTYPPYMVADQNRVIHAFNSQWFDDQLAIVYSQWSYDLGWTTPTDILLSPLKKQARILGAYLDNKGVMHVVFFGGDDIEANIYYAYALTPEASIAPAWSEPEIIGEDAATPTIGALLGDNEGNLHVVYSGRNVGKGLYATHSVDGGTSWSEFAPIFLTYDDQLFPWALQLQFDQSDRLHALWTVNNISGNGDAIFYARRQDAGSPDSMWETPILFAEAAGYEADWPSLVSYNDELLVVFNNSQPATRWMSRSLDGGTTWTEPIRPFPHIGEYGHANFLIDSANRLHIILGNRTNDNPAQHGMWHAVWQGDHWSELTPIVSGPRTLDFDPNKPKSIISQGNRLLATWRTDEALEPNGIWYSVLTLEVPELPIVPLPVIAQPTTQAVQVAEALPTSIPASEPAPDFGDDFVLDSSANNLAQSLALGMIPAVLFVLLIVIIHRFRLTRR